MKLSEFQNQTNLLPAETELAFDNSEFSMIPLSLHYDSNQNWLILNGKNDNDRVEQEPLDEFSRAERITKAFEALDDQHWCKHPNEFHPNDEIDLFLKVMSLMKQPRNFKLHAEYKELLLCSPEEFKDNITLEDLQYLHERGVIYNDSYDQFTIGCSA